MRGWLDEVAGSNFAPAVLWTLLALVVLVIVLVIIRIVRSMTFGTFVAGGRNRKTRLAVMDAAAVDSQRRLVLVRRDEVEHLILIGGPTDVVVERDIRLHVPSRRPAGSDAAESQQRLRPAEIPGQPRPAQQPARPEQRTPQPAAAVHPQPPKASPAPVPAARPAPVRMPPVSSMPAQPPAAIPARPSPPAAAVTTAPPVSSTPPATPRLKPLEPAATDTGFNTTTKMRPRPEMTLEDEMNRLLGELSNKK